MSSTRIRLSLLRTWLDFWGEFLLVRFHRDNPDRWPSRERKARTIWETLRLAPGARVLDLGCGDGLLDIALARLGAHVTAVDRIESVLAAARSEAGSATVTFRVGDLRAVSPKSRVASLESRCNEAATLLGGNQGSTTTGLPSGATNRSAAGGPVAHSTAVPPTWNLEPGTWNSSCVSERTFDAVLLLDTLGLMSREDDRALLVRAAAWLKPGGHLLADVPLEPQGPIPEFHRDFPEGELCLRSKYDAPTRLLHIELALERRDGSVIRLHDPYDPSRGDHEGVLRYLYPRAEVVDALTQAGFSVSELAHLWSARHSMFVGRNL